MMYFYSVIQKTASLFIFIGAAIYPFHSVPLYDELFAYDERMPSLLSSNAK